MKQYGDGGWWQGQKREEKHSRKKKESERHHEQIPSVQNTFLAQTKNVTDVIEEHDNPFEKMQAKHSIRHLLWSD